MMKRLGSLLEGSGFKGQNTSQESRSQNKHIQASSTFDFLELISNWQDIVGKVMAKHSIPLRLSQKSLTILTDHPTYSQSLKLLEQMLVEKIENQFPVLKTKLLKLQFQVNSQFFNETKEIYANNSQLKSEKEKLKPVLHPQSPEFKRLKKESENYLGDISDEEIKNSLTSLFIQLKTQK